MNQLSFKLDEPFDIKEEILKQGSESITLDGIFNLNAFHNLRDRIYSTFKDDLEQYGLGHKDVVSCLSKKNTLPNFVSWVKGDVTWKEAWEKFLICLSSKKLKNEESNNLVPTEGEVAKLPLWARVAFATRCARRVQHLYHFCDVKREHKNAIENAIKIAEELAGMPPRLEKYPHAATAAKIAAHDAADVAINTESYIRVVAYAAADAARAVVADDGRSAFRSAAAASSSINTILIQHVRSDYELLLQLSQKENWNDKTPVPVTVFPPLPKPDESEDDKTADQSNIKHETGKPIFVTFDPDRVPDELICEFLEKLNNLYSEHSGDELIIREDETGVFEAKSGAYVS